MGNPKTFKRDKKQKIGRTKSTKSKQNTSESISEIFRLAEFDAAGGQ